MYGKMFDSFVSGLSLNIVVFSLFVWKCGRKNEKSNTLDVSSYEQLIGNTPLIRLNKLSAVLGCNIYAKVSEHFV